MKSLLLAPSDLARQQPVVLCGDVMPHRKQLSDSASKAAGFSFISCSEDREEALALCRRLNTPLFVARQAFLEQLLSSDLVLLSNYGKSSYILSVLASDTFDKSSAAKMLRLGCRGVLPNGFSFKLFRRAASAIFKGEFWAPRAVVSELLADLLRAASLITENGLTPQEARILELTLQGYKNSAIAEALFISLETVRWHKRRLNRKLHKPNRIPQTKASAPSRKTAVS